ncbi:hypothetical protein BJ741DRAFT_633595, partial [Chytriomyces cf. hyalinus JEL632]
WIELKTTDRWGLLLSVAITTVGASSYICNGQGCAKRFVGTWANCMTSPRKATPSQSHQAFLERAVTGSDRQDEGLPPGYDA